MSRLNLSATNKAFKKALSEPIKSLYHYNGCGFFDGGCLLLADALVLWSGGDLKLGGCVREAHKRTIDVDHWFVTTERLDSLLCLDANGLMTPSAFIRYWEHVEALGQIMFRIQPSPRVDGEIPRDLMFSKLLSNQLEQALGPYEQWIAEVIQNCVSSQGPGALPR
ncbi:hypothetical protein [Pseudomonas sp. Leaf58]|uniref:hypothetical protein n=1 Tax=unclassified Pseudomonas TaxID=196821 RepID=UPI000B22D505|nr:hypothetical protein [Pseudomonas sp. Leaf58]